MGLEECAVSGLMVKDPAAASSFLDRLYAWDAWLPELAARREAAGEGAAEAAAYRARAQAADACRSRRAADAALTAAIGTAGYADRETEAKAVKEAETRKKAGWVGRSFIITPPLQLKPPSSIACLVCFISLATHCYPTVKVRRVVVVILPTLQ